MREMLNEPLTESPDKLLTEPPNKTLNVTLNEMLTEALNKSLNKALNESLYKTLNEVLKESFPLLHTLPTRTFTTPIHLPLTLSSEAKHSHWSCCSVADEGVEEDGTSVEVVGVVAW